MTPRIQPGPWKPWAVLTLPTDAQLADVHAQLNVVVHLNAPVRYDPPAGAPSLTLQGARESHKPRVRSKYPRVERWR